MLPRTSFLAMRCSRRTHYERHFSSSLCWDEAHYNPGHFRCKTFDRGDVRVSPGARLQAGLTSKLIAIWQQLSTIRASRARRRRALAERLRFGRATFNVLSASLLMMSRAEEAIGCFRRAASAKTDDAALHSKVIFALNFDPTVRALNQPPSARAPTQSTTRFGSGL
jgi:hypothetical protein